MTARIKHGLLTKLKAMARQARCPLCGEKLGPLEGLDWDHETALALGGADDETNLRAVHRTCHRVKTSGNGASTAGTDIGKIAKVNRITDKKAARFSGPARGIEIGAEPTREARKPRKTIQSRGFDKSRRRKLNGEVEVRT